jgi:hypothetical protein
MKIILLFFALTTSCVSSQFFIKENDRLGKVIVNECRIVTFRNIDNGQTVDKSYCRKVVMTPNQKKTWEQVSSFAASDVTGLKSGENTEE